MRIRQTGRYQTFSTVNRNTRMRIYGSADNYEQHSNLVRPPNEELIKLSPPLHACWEIDAAVSAYLISL